MSAVDAHLAALDAALRVPRRARRRILAECADHLHEAAAARRAAGLAPAEAGAAAVSAFGDPVALAARFTLEHATASTARATRAAAVAVGAFAVLFVAATQLPAGRAANPFGAADAVAWVAIQVAVTAAGLSVLRAWRHRRDAAVAPDQLRYVLHGDLVAAVGAGVAAAADLAGAAQAGAPHGTALALTAGAGALAALSAAATLVTAGALIRVRGAQDAPGVAALEAPGRGDDAVATLAPLLRPVPGARRALDLLRTRPWEAAITLALLAGAAGAAAGLREHAPSTPSELGRALLAAVVVLALEATAVLAGFAVLGRYLGLRR